MTKSYLKYRARITVLSCFIILSWSLLCARLFQIQILDKDLYSAKGILQGIYTEVLNPSRGNIYDRNNVPLTRNISHITLCGNPSEIAAKKEVAKLLSECSGKLESYYSNKLSKTKSFVYLERNIRESQCLNLSKLKKYGVIVKLIYHIMFFFVTKNSNLIICNKRLSKKKNYHLVFPSQLNENWFVDHKKVLLDKIRLLYVGRMRVEKGIYQFMKMLDKMNMEGELSIVSDIVNLNNINKKINLLGFGYDTKSLIKIYDDHNIFILPSFTEAHPQVVLESLSRRRPVIIFEEIKHIIGDKKGIFVSKRNEESFLRTTKYIMENYIDIQESMSANKLPTKKEFISHMSNILSKN